MGFALQLTALALLTTVGGWPYVYATAIAVELAVLHNFVWHERWTWSDRRHSALAPGSRLVKYHLVAAMTSMAGNVALTAAVVELAGAPVLVANVTAVGAMAAANFIAADRWVFYCAGITPATLSALTPWRQPPTDQNGAR
jgi:putative flippase GtrA